MSSQVRRSLALALAGLAAGLGLVLALYGGPEALRRATGRPPAATRDAPQAEPRAETPSETRSEPRSEVWAHPPAAPSGAGAPEAPRFDIVRIEPNGEAVVAGRGAPNTVVEMLVDGKPVARALADPGGQFALVPPALPPGSSEIVLRSRSADGREVRSQQSVAVSVAPGRDARPLVALTAPDRPTQVLSQPGAPEPGRGAAPGTGAKAGGTPDAKPGARPDAKPAAGQPARIVSVDAETGGRLYVTGTAPPGARLRLYLNDTLVAPATAGPDGRVTFTIGRGVRPGRYQVRIDQVDPATGAVSGRAEVPFAMPEAVAARPAPAEPPRAEGAAAAPSGGATAGMGGGVGGGAAGEAGRVAGAVATPEPRPADPGRAAALRPAAPEPPAGEGQTGAVFVPEISTARITRGDNLWQISKRTYGRGERYTVIYDANQAQIRDPDLIYPGQIFVLPTDKRG